jgi:hypothetical protein
VCVSGRSRVQLLMPELLKKIVDLSGVLGEQLSIGK